MTFSVTKIALQKCKANANQVPLWRKIERARFFRACPASQARDAGHGSGSDFCKCKKGSVGFHGAGPRCEAVKSSSRAEFEKCGREFLQLQKSFLRLQKETCASNVECRGSLLDYSAATAAAEKFIVD